MYCVSRSGVVCRVKYCNSLPDIPFDPKFITYPFDQHRWSSSFCSHRKYGEENMDEAGLFCYLYFCRFVQYKATSLEKQHKHDLLSEPDLGVTIDLINPDTYRIDPSGKWQFHRQFFFSVGTQEFFISYGSKKHSSTLNIQVPGFPEEGCFQCPLEWTVHKKKKCSQVKMLNNLSEALFDFYALMWSLFLF